MSIILIKEGSPFEGQALSDISLEIKGLIQPLSGILVVASLLCYGVLNGLPSD